MSQDLSTLLDERRQYFDDMMAHYFSGLDLVSYPAVLELRQSMEYSATKGGKRFRPVLCYLIAEAFGVHPQKVTPFACAVEMIHTYSLIHDDLPCMDNDDVRRGEPTNHKVYGEAVALLAGDALLTEAFYLLSVAFPEEPKTSVHLIRLLSEAAGIRGMVGGQAIDMKAQDAHPGIEELTSMHEMKTGALIRVCAEGSAVACGLPEKQIQLCHQFGAHLGLAFQLKDDLLDSSEGELEPGSYPAVLGLEKTKQFLDQTTDKALAELRQLGIFEGPLVQLVEYNRTRMK
ncbi:MAG: farnesyl diphosphate synthase [Oligoflexia bacterium]|nr:MAG: farnesyl diphosphate synthase [Oligoflexia bacterium]